MPAEAFGMTIFCDDIRYEVSGKVTLVGCYRTDMVIHGGDFPITIAKLGLAINYFEPRDWQWMPMEIRVYFPGDEDDSPSIKAPVTQAPSPSDGLVRSIRVEMILGPVTIARPGHIRVRAYRNANETWLGTLIIRKADPQAS